MDQQSQTPPPATIPEPQPTQPQPPIKSGGFLAFLRKLLLWLIFGLILLSAGYYLGAKNFIQPTPTPTPTPTTVVSSPTQVIPSPTLTFQKTKTVKAGLSGGNFFTTYSVDIPDGWIDARETTIAAGIDKLTLTKNGYSITIYQAAMGGGGCLYPGDKPADMSQTFSKFATINGHGGQFRRSWNEPGGAATISYTVCMQGADKSYGVLSPYGVINVVSPNPPDTSILAEIDGILASIVKQ
ncbi:MAG TPA: hypothetical protein VF810_01100 [Patescibacteria group bacterium]